MAKEMGANSKAELSSTQQFLVSLIGAESDLILHPLEVKAKKAQLSPTAFVQETAKKISAAPKAMNSGFDAIKQGFVSNTNGILFSAVNKAASRSLRYTGQAKMQTVMQQKIEKKTKNYLSDSQGKTLTGLVTGAVSGSLETTICYPLDLLKTRKELEIPNPSKTFEMLKANKTINALALATDARNLYKNLDIALVRNSIQSAGFFAFFNYFQNKNKNLTNSKTKNNLITTTESALVNTVITNPIEVLKTTMQASAKSNQSKSICQSAKDIYHQGGMQAYAKGIQLRLMKAPASVVLPFYTFVCAKDYLEKRNETNSFTLRA